MKTTILAFGKVRGYEADWCAEYLKRLSGFVTVRELAAPASLPSHEVQKAEMAILEKSLPAKPLLVVLDERGKDLTSRDFAQKLQSWQDRAPSDLVFVIGGADGVTDEFRARADFLWGFGRATWPHRLVRVMLLEQLYRARQILAGHPYHRD